MGQWLGLSVYTAKGPGLILVGELRFPKLCGSARKEKKKKMRRGTSLQILQLAKG